MVEMLLIGLIVAAFVYAYSGSGTKDAGHDGVGPYATHSRQADEDDGGWNGGDGGD